MENREGVRGRVTSLDVDEPIPQQTSSFIGSAYNPSYNPVRLGSRTQNLYGMFWGGLMLSFGTVVTILQKIAYSTEAKGLPGAGTDFKKPWFIVALMKMSMGLCLFAHLLSKRATNGSTRNSEGRDVAFVDADSRRRGDMPAQPDWKTLASIALPSMLDLANVLLGSVGLVFVSSSIFQMTRGSVVIFSAVLSVQLLKRRLESYHYCAIALVCLSVALVGFAGVMASGSGDSSLVEVIFGLLLIFFAQLVLAYQIVVEERLMTADPPVTPIQLVAYEGLWGILYFVLLVPILNLTPASNSSLSIVWHEDFHDTFVKLQNSPSLCVVSALFSVIVCLYNLGGQAVTKYLNSVVRSILEACRTLGVWVVGLLLWYVGDDHKNGEEWTAWSWFELCGFGLLIYGTMAYKQLLPTPCAPTAEVEEMRPPGDTT